jgi:hypothetical protein
MYYYIMSNKELTTANVVWIATALLHRENKDKDAFSTRQIFDKSKSLNLLRSADATLMMHISLHCVANAKAQPDKHRKIFRVVKGWYRLYRPGDTFDESRANGRSVPLAEEVPEKYGELIDWYNTEYCKEVKKASIPRDVITNAVFAKIEVGKSLTLPDDAFNFLQLEEGDYVAFIMNTEGEIILKKAKMKFEV